MPKLNDSLCVCIVEPRLWTIEGHEFDHVIEFARGIKACKAHQRVVALTGPPDSKLASALRQERAIDAVLACFPKRWISDGSPFSVLLKASLHDAFALRSALNQLISGQQVLLCCSSLALYQLLML